MKIGGKRKNKNSQILLSLTTVYHIKLNEKYEWLSVYFLMIKNWDSMNKSKNKYEQILMIEKWDSINKSKNKY